MKYIYISNNTIYKTWIWPVGCSLPIFALSRYTAVHWPFFILQFPKPRKLLPASGAVLPLRILLSLLFRILDFSLSETGSGTGWHLFWRTWNKLDFRVWSPCNY